MYEFFVTDGELNIYRIVWCAVIVIALLRLIAIYNRLNRMRNNVKQLLATIDVKLTQRNDELTNLIGSCKSYMTHENSTFEKIAQLRAQASNLPVASDEKISINSEISTLSRGLMMQVESYPVLQANAHISHLMRSINEIEEQISATRRSFNAAATEYNNAIQSFPTVLYAMLFHFKSQKLYEATADERKNPNVSALFK